MKRCNACENEKSLEAYYQDRTKPDGRQSKCKTCQSLYSKSDYKANKRLYKDRANRSRAKIAGYVNQLKESSPCSDCGNFFPYWIMTFDHIRGKKEFNITKGIKTVSFKTLKAEIRKCEIVCCNCHADRTYRRAVGD